MADQLKCLMIGQAGIGKTSLLRAIPNAKLVMPDEKKSALNHKETYMMESTDFHGESTITNVEIENVDITLETCLQDSGLALNHSIISSHQVINLNNVDVIIFCFALDDINSFHLIQSIWDIYFKNMRKNLNIHKFILL